MVVASSHLSAQETPLLRLSFVLQEAGTSNRETATLEMRKGQLDETIASLEACLEGKHCPIESTGHRESPLKDAYSNGDLRSSDDWGRLDRKSRVIEDNFIVIVTHMYALQWHIPLWSGHINTCVNECFKVNSGWIKGPQNLFTFLY